MRAALFLSAALIAAPAAYAQSNDQYQGGAATSSTVVDVGTAGDVGATAIASGNVVTAAAEDADASFENLQHMDGATNAAADVTVWSANGVAVTSAAVANGGTASVSDSTVELDSTQLAHGDANASVNFTGGSAAYAGTSASASGNTAAISAQNSELRLLSNQESTGSITAAVEADHGGVSGQVVSGVVASANNFSAGSETATVLTDLRQSAIGEAISARTDLYAAYATDASANATANANAVTIDNQWGYVNAAIQQNATASVSADSYVTLGGDFLGFASSGAYGVGNQANVSNVGSDTVLDVTQSNTGGVSANAATDGEGGQMALASAAAYGNSITGYVCNNCDVNVPSLSANSMQTNDGDVTSTATVRTTRAQTVGATSTAIGNAATYSTAGVN